MKHLELFEILAPVLGAFVSISVIILAMAYRFM